MQSSAMIYDNRAESFDRGLFQTLLALTRGMLAGYLVAHSPTMEILIG